MDHKTNIHELKKTVKEFCEERNWDPHHSAKNLAIGVITEASELLEHFRFKDEKQSEEMMNDPDKKSMVCEEVSDVLYFILRLAQKYDIDLASEFRKKMEKNNKKYPVKQY